MSAPAETQRRSARPSSAPLELDRGHFAFDAAFNVDGRALAGCEDAIMTRDAGVLTYRDHDVIAFGPEGDATGEGQVRDRVDIRTVTDNLESGTVHRGHATEDDQTASSAAMKSPVSCTRTGRQGACRGAQGGEGGGGGQGAKDLRHRQIAWQVKKSEAKRGGSDGQCLAGAGAARENNPS